MQNPVISALLAFVAVWKQNVFLGLSSTLLNLVSAICSHVLSELSFPGISGLVPKVNVVVFMFLYLVLLTLLAVVVWRAK